LWLIRHKAAGITIYFNTLNNPTVIKCLLIAGIPECEAYIENLIIFAAVAEIKDNNASS